MFAVVRARRRADRPRRGAQRGSLQPDPEQRRARARDEGHRRGRGRRRGDHGRTRQLAGTVLGVVLLGAIGPALTFLGVSAYWERAIQGAIILAAVAIDALRGRAAETCRGDRRRACVDAEGASALVPNGEWVLLLALAGEIALFSAIAPNFFTLANFFEIIAAQRRARPARDRADAGHHHRRHRSVGRLDDGAGGRRLRRGVARLASADAVAAAALRLLRRAAPAAALNALLVARLGIPPLIVTLGTFSLFRGIAEGHHAGAGQLHRLSRGVPGARPGLSRRRHPGAVAAVRLAVRRATSCCCIDRSIGRALYAIGFTPAGARYAGIPVARRSALVYLLSGLSSSLAAIIYVAHLGQARSDAGNGYELDAITAVVLGGTSVFGGRGTLWGTLLGLFSLSVLQNGLHLAALPSELTGVLTGVLLSRRLRSIATPARRERAAVVRLHWRRPLT